jgi:hypothetical protein
MSVGAHSRHIQEGLVLLSAERMQKSGEEEPTATRAKAWGLTGTKGLASEGPNGRVGAATAQAK